MDAALAALEALYRDLRAPTAELDRIHAGRLRCARGCRDCCVDGITVFEVEAENIRRRHPRGPEETPHPGGACAFLVDDGSCRVYEARPYVCRTQGYPLRWLDERDGATVEMRDICPLNDGGDPIEQLPRDACWTLGPFEGRLAAIQARLDGGELRRVALRAVFEGPP